MNVKALCEVWPRYDTHSNNATVGWSLYIYIYICIYICKDLEGGWGVQLNNHCVSFINSCVVLCLDYWRSAILALSASDLMWSFCHEPSQRIKKKKQKKKQLKRTTIAVSMKDQHIT